ncbi:hypothetical protein SK128_013779 [Halocaridina rubra]|uniref:BRCA1-A complex subunit Abraxas 1 n=1 Tax=Halocaridina rubra TaxID=373956 RepID=A0AAN8XN21_HALRR
MSGHTGVKVSCSGAVLASLLYETLRSGHPQEGFLLGTIESHISEHISDSQICNEKMETLINVSSFLPCTMIGSFYSGAGELDREKLSGYLGHSFKHVIGWYRSRGSCDDLYTREILLHQQLSKIMTHTGGHFILGILSCSPSNGNGTFTVSHKFMMQQNGNFEGVVLQVINMGDTSTAEYRLRPRNPALYTSNAVNTVLSSLENCEPGVTEAESLHSGLLKRLDNLLPKFSSSEKELEKVLEEVSCLRLLCGNNGVSLDFTPEIRNITDEQNLMEFEDTLSLSSHSLKGKATPQKGPVKKKGKLVKEDKGSPDLFGFVNKEMEKLQVKGLGSPPKRLSRSRTNTPSPVDVTKKSKYSTRTKRASSRNNSESNDESLSSMNKHSKSNSSESSQKDSQEGGSGGRGGGSKAGRGLGRTPSKERKSPSRVTRSQSPAVSNLRGTQRRRKEAWSDKSNSGSQEY